MNKTVLLIGFYNERALGVRYLANSLRTHGFDTHILYFKEFNSIRPTKATERELKLLERVVERVKPIVIGLSVMSSLYLESVYLVNHRIKKSYNCPIVWGGVYPTLFPDRALEHCHYVIRGEGEKSFPELLEGLVNNRKVHYIENLVFRDENDRMVINPIRHLEQNLDNLGYPQIGGENIYFIHNDTLYKGDPQLNGLTYELTASRGCPFTCSYCSSINLKRIHQGKGKYVRFRSVDNVLEELREAKFKIRKLRVIHFWDEIFSDEPGWIEEFSHRYRKEIGIPFKIWGHPLKINENTIKKLVDAGLYQIVVGIQSGSDNIRKDIFHRTETQEDILKASTILANSKVPRVIYDYMLKHPFESIEDLKATFKMSMDLKHPFELQIHGLNFLPGTGIIDLAIRDGYLTMDELENIMYSSIEDQYNMYWGPAAAKRESAEDIWISLIYLTQFPVLKPIIRTLAREVEKGNGEKVVLTLKKIMERISGITNIAKKVKLVAGR